MPPFPSSAFRIDREGVWRHEGQEVTHPGVVENLYANLRADADGHFLQVGPVRVPVVVDDAPFVVVRVEPEGTPGAPETLRVSLSDGTTERLDPTSLWMDANQTPYCRVKAGRFAARLALAAWLQLAGFVTETPDTGELWLTVGETRVRLSKRPG